MSVGQTRFRRAVLDPALPVPDGLLDGRGQPAGKRFSVYRNNVAVSLTEALESGFPVIAKLLGPNNFRAVMGEYLRSHPPQSPLMMHYGTDLPDFLAGFAPLAHFGYLPDVARLELALRHAYHAADASPLAPARLANLPLETLAGCRLTFSPATQILRSAWPIHAIWCFNMENGRKPVPQPQDVLIARRDHDPRLFALQPGSASFIEALMDHAALAQAHEMALQEAETFDLAALIAQLLDGEAITDIHAERST